jgi:hypothetical protein
MAFIELGLTEEEFFSMPPFRTYLMQLAGKRKYERMWEQTRFLAAKIQNYSMRSKNTVHPKHLVPLSFDKKSRSDQPEWTQQDAEKLLKIWPDIQKKN